MTTIRLPATAIIFDSDGVLVDSHLDGHRAWSQMAVEFGFDLDDEIFATLVGVRPADSLRRFVEPDRLNEAIDRLEDLEVSLASDTPALAGANDLLTTLPPDRWAIATSASRRLALARWNGAGIPVPEIVVAAEDVTHGKPHPEPYRTAASMLGVDPTACVVFEDSPSGGKAGLDAGMTVVAVGDQPWPFEPAIRIETLRDVSVASTVATSSDAPPTLLLSLSAEHSIPPSMGPTDGGPG